MSKTDTDKLDIDQTESDPSTLVDWETPPSLADLNQELDSAQVAHHVHIEEVDAWLRVLMVIKLLMLKEDVLS